MGRTMATSTVARTSTMAPLLFIAMFLTALASAQSVSPSNTTFTDTELSRQTKLTLNGDDGQASFSLAPLTPQTGKNGLSPTEINTTRISGQLRPIDPSNMNNITRLQDIAYVSCDPNVSPTSGFIDASAVVTTVGDQVPKAIILYSLTSQDCLINNYTFQTVYSMTKQADSNALFMKLQQTRQINATIGTNASSNGQGNSASTTNNDGAPAPTTAVAMSILYSITGIITLLFLIIIATGAIRAHRHPERYGPRTGNTGRPRQSRAKGLARAMLETLPIVKFGDPEPVKPESRDIELEGGDTTPSEITTAPESTPATNEAKTTATSTIASGMGPNTQAEARKSEEPAARDGELGCSICTEDFTTGEDVRVLPCKHKYHPACIDPWLLNVSGTCPLCRHDLRPVATEPTAEGSELPPPLSTTEDGTPPTASTSTSPVPAGEEDTHQRHRASRFLDLHRLRTAPPDERIAALRRLREQSRQDGDEVDDVEEPTRRARLTGRLRDTFRIRTRRQDGVSPSEI